MSKKSSARFRFNAAALLLAALLFLVPALKDGNRALYMLAVLVPCAMFLCGTLLARMFSLDRMILSVTLLICAAGIAAFALSDPDAALAQALRCGAGLFALVAGGVMTRTLRPSLLTSVCTAFLGLLLLAAKLISPAVTLPLAEAALALLLISFASLLARQGPVSAVVCGLSALVLLLVRGETTEALIWGMAVLLLLFAVDGRMVVVLPALAAMLVLSFCVFRLLPSSAESQGASLLEALTSVGAVGADTLPDAVASADTVSLFPRLAGHYGLLFAGLTVLLFLPMILRGTAVASSARTRFHAALAMGVCLLLAFRALASLLSFFGILPLPGAVIPLLSVSLPALCAQLFLIGLLCGISGRNDADLAEDAHLAMLAG